MSRGFSPLDDQLRLFERTCSESVAKLAVWLCGQVTVRAAETILEQLGGITFSDTSIWRRVQIWGAKLQAQEDLDRAQATALPQRGTITPVPQATSKDMGIAMDGVMIPLREEGFKELKVGCVFDIALHPAPDAVTGEFVEHAQAVHLSYTTVLGGPDRFGQALWAEAVRRELPQAREVVAIADAAKWVWETVVPEHFSTSQQVVDWYHAKEHLYTAGHLVYGEGSPAATRWVKAMETPLYQGHAVQIAATLRQLADEHPTMADPLQTEAGYFENNQRRMQYLEFREEGFPIGSGMVESGCKQFRTRLAGAGMRWSRPGVENLLPIRAAILSDCFDTKWCTVYKSPLN